VFDIYADQQRSFEELGTPLHEVTFCVLDLETTGGSYATDAITEIGAVKLRGGECLGRFETLVNPGVPIPPLITVLTGITEAMVLPAPMISEALPSFLEFLGDAVIVGHNVRFDISFLDAACEAHGAPRLANRRTDTLGLARRLVRDEVPNLKLSTLARHLRVPTEPVHRAMADAQATAEVFHTLLERAASFGVLGLDDLLALPSMHAHPSAQKLGLTAKLPREPGVYVFRDRHGRPLYVGKATNLRARVRSYFSGDDRRKIPQLLREAAAIDHVVCRDPLEAAIREIRLIRQWQPRFNRQGKSHKGYSYVRLTRERFPRIVVTRTAAHDGSLHLGPLPSSAFAHLVREAIETAVPLRRCTRRIGRRTPIVDCGVCTAAQLGVATCPCSGAIAEDDYRELAARVERGLSGEPELLFEPLEQRMQRFARDDRYEEAAMTRDRLAALARALRRRDSIDAVRMPARLELVRRDANSGVAARVELQHGRLVIEAGPGSSNGVEPPDLTAPPAHGEVDELLIIARFVEREARRWRVASAEGAFAWRLPRVASYEPVARATR
jgi:DNA polymerase-3 subunit epsilon